MKTVLHWANIILKALASVIVGGLIIVATVGYVAVMTVVWAINAWAGMAMLIFGLSVIALVAYS